METEKFAIRIESISGDFIAYLEHNKRTAWSLKTAKNKAWQYWKNNPHLKILVEADLYADIPKAIYVKV